MLRAGVRWFEVLPTPAGGPAVRGIASTMDVMSPSLRHSSLTCRQRSRWPENRPPCRYARMVSVMTTQVRAIAEIVQHCDHRDHRQSSAQADPRSVGWTLPMTRVVTRSVVNGCGTSGPQRWAAVPSLLVVALVIVVGQLCKAVHCRSGPSPRVVKAPSPATLGPATPAPPARCEARGDHRRGRRREN